MYSFEFESPTTVADAVAAGGCEPVDAQPVVSAVVSVRITGTAKDLKRCFTGALSIGGLDVAAHFSSDQCLAAPGGSIVSATIYRRKRVTDAAAPRLQQGIGRRLMGRDRPDSGGETDL